MILDTSFIIDIMENDAGAIDRKRTLTEKNESYRVSAATIFELWSGIACSRKSQEEKTKVLKALAGLNIISLNAQIAEKAGEIHGLLLKEGNAIDHIDAMLAATSLLENEAILTRNIKHFGRVRGLKVESY